MSLDFKNPYPISIYVHFPFCLYKCKYCSFDVQNSSSNELMKKYLDCVLKESMLFSKSFKGFVRTVYFGGGTPSFIPNNIFLDFLLKFKKIWNIDKIIEFNIESNAEDITLDFIKILNENNINRLSLGVQSFCDNTLKRIGRKTNKDKNLKSISLIKKYYKYKFNMDLITSIPMQKKEELIFDVETALSFQPEHISLYTLEIDEDKDFYSLIKNGYIKDISPKRYSFLWKTAHEKLKENGYLNYEISNYAKDSYKNYSFHNMVYWNPFNFYLGLGSSASSFLKDRFEKKYRIKNQELFRYMSKINRGLQYQDIEELDKNSLTKDVLLTSLRSKFGINYKKLKDRYDIDLLSLQSILSLKQKNYFEKEWFEQGIMILKEKYRFILDYLLIDIFLEIDND